MARKRILLMLAAIAVGLLVLSTILTSDPAYYRVYGSIYKSHGLHDGAMDVHLDPIDPPGGGEVQPAYYYGDSTWVYAFYGIDDGDFKVWAEYEDVYEICTSSEYPITVDGDDVQQDITIYSYQCEDQP